MSTENTKTTPVTADAAVKKPETVKVASKSVSEAFRDAAGKALSGGISGAMAMVIQVCSLMWMRTTMNYQYRYGTTTTVALKTLYAQGGVARFYRGIGPALLQGPLSRFGDTAANNGTLVLLESVNIPVGVKTALASVSAALFRIVLMPIDATKTILQVEGKGALKGLYSKIQKNGVGVLWHGSLGAMTATFAGHYPWFFTYNYLNSVIPRYDELKKRLLRSAFIGFAASVISDSISNGLRVVKTYRQTSSEPISYLNAAKAIADKEGYMGLLGRGLKTRIITNGMQGLLFSVMWRVFQDWFDSKDKNK